MLDLSFLSFSNLLLWIGGWSLVGFLLMAEDKDQAQTQEGLAKRERISERTLYEVAVLGGFLGILAGASVFHHKTSKESFWGPVFLSAILWAVFLAVLTNGTLSGSLRGLTGR